MSNSIVYRSAGPTYALSVANTQHTAVAISNGTNDVVCYASFINRGATDVCVVVYPLTQAGAAQAPTLVFPVDGTPTIPNSFLLPAGMLTPYVVAVPTTNNGFSVSAIGSAAGPSIIYITAVVAQ